MTIGQSFCLVFPTLLSSFWAYVFITANTDVYQYNHGKSPSGPDTIFAFGIAGIYIAAMVFLSLASFFNTDAVKRLVLRAYTLIFAGVLYFVYQNKTLFLEEPFKMNIAILGAGFAISFLGGFVLSPAATEKKKRF